MIFLSAHFTLNIKKMLESHWLDNAAALTYASKFSISEKWEGR